MLNILILRGYCPLKKAIVISDRYGIEIDNPRTEKEIEYISAYISGFNLEGLYRRLERLIAKKSPRPIRTDGHFINRTSQEIARNWLIIRFDDGGFFDDWEGGELRQKARRDLGLFSPLIRIKKDHPVYKKYTRAIHLSNILGLIFADKLGGKPHQSILVEQKSVDLSIGQLPILTGFEYITRGMFELDTIGKNIGIVKTLCRALNKLTPEQFERAEYIGELLSVVNISADIRVRLILIFSILELLITHIPSGSNDSINWQLTIKTSLIAQKYLKKDADQIAREIRGLYGLRSSIVHGNFRKPEYRNFIRIPHAGEDKGYNATIRTLYKYALIVTKEYILNPDKIEELKRS